MYFGHVHVFAKMRTQMLVLRFSGVRSVLRSDLFTTWECQRVEKWNLEKEPQPFLRRDRILFVGRQSPSFSMRKRQVFPSDWVFLGRDLPKDGSRDGSSDFSDMPEPKVVERLKRLASGATLVF